MSNSWFRIGNFSQSKLDGLLIKWLFKNRMQQAEQQGLLAEVMLHDSADAIVNAIRFRSTSSFLLKDIYIRHYKNQKIIVDLFPVFRNINLVTAIFKNNCRASFEPIQDAYDDQYKIRFAMNSASSASNFKEIIALLDFINKKYGSKEISEEIMNDLKQVCAWLQQPNRHEHIKHFTPEIPNVAHVNPNLSDSLNLLKFMQDSEKRMAILYLTEEDSCLPPRQPRIEYDNDEDDCEYTKSFTDLVYVDEYECKQLDEQPPSKSKAKVSIHEKYSQEIKSREKVFDKYVVAGENPNQFDKEGNTPLSIAISLGIRYTKKLVYIARANPFFRAPVSENENIFFESPFESAERMGKVEHFKAMLDSTTNLTRKMPLKRIASNTVEYKNHILKTEFKFQDGVRLISMVKRPTDLAHDEAEAVFALFCEQFERTKKNGERLHWYMSEEYIKLMRHIFFNEDLAGKSKLIELLYAGEEQRVIGINLYEILRSTDKKDSYFHWAYSMLLPAYRGICLMKLFSYRLAYALHRTLPSDQKNVLIFYMAASFNSFRMMLEENDKTQNNDLFFPYYQSQYIIDRLNELINLLYGEKVHFIHDGLTCFVEESDPLIVKEAKRGDISGDQEMFNLVQDRTATSLNTPRVTPVISLVADHGYRKISQKLKQEMSLDFDSHTLTIAQQAVSFFQEYHGKQRDPHLKLSIPNALQTFFGASTDKRNSEKALKTEKQPQMTIRSKL